MEGDDEHRAEGVVVKVREERALLFDWWTPENPQSLRVEIVIEDAGRVRRIAVTEEGFGHDERGLRLRTRREEVWRRRLTELSRIAEGRTSAVRLGE